MLRYSIIALLVLGIAFATCTQPQSGDWTINSSESCSFSDQQMTLNGDLFVYGTLNLDNVTVNIGTYNSIYLYGAKADIKDSYLAYSNSFAIFLVDIENAVFENNTFWWTHGIYLKNSSENTFTGNTITSWNSRGTSTAVVLVNSNNNDFNGNTIKQAASGMVFFESHDNTVRENALHVNDIAFDLINESSGNVFKDNNAFGYITSAFLYDTVHDNLFENNILTTNVYPGVWVWGAKNNIFINNEISSGRNAGVYLTYLPRYDSTPTGNEFVGNDITGKLQGILISQSTENSFSNNFIHDSNIGFRFYQSSKNEVRDSIISNSAHSDINVEKSDVEVLNVTFDKAKTNVISGSLTVRWYLKIITLTEKLKALRDVYIEGNDVFDALQFTGTTNNKAELLATPIEYIETPTGKTFYEPYTVTGTKKKYLPATNTVGLTYNNITTLILKHRRACIDGETKPCALGNDQPGIHICENGAWKACQKEKPNPNKPKK